MKYYKALIITLAITFSSTYKAPDFVTLLNEETNIYIITV